MSNLISQIILCSACLISLVYADYDVKSALNDEYLRYFSSAVDDLKGLLTKDKIKNLSNLAQEIVKSDPDFVKHSNSPASKEVLTATLVSFFKQNSQTNDCSNKEEFVKTYDALIGETCSRVKIQLAMMMMFINGSLSDPKMQRNMNKSSWQWLVIGKMCSNLVIDRNDYLDSIYRDLV